MTYGDTAEGGNTGTDIPASAPGSPLCAPRIRFEIAPPVMSGGRPTVSGVLHRILASDRPIARIASNDRALLLGAVWYRLATGVLEDLALPPAMPASPRWRRPPELGRLRQPVSPCEITWSGLRPMQVRPLPRLHALLWALPERLVDAVIAWAPPVVLPADRHGQRRVVANHFSAVLARQRHPDAQLPVCPLVRPGSWPPRRLPELCQATAQVLWPLYRDHEHRLVELAHDEAEAAWLTGYARAQYFRIRRGAGAGKR